MKFWMGLINLSLAFHYRTVGAVRNANVSSGDIFLSILSLQIRKVLRF
jgi:hypothetical protein